MAALRNRWVSHWLAVLFAVLAFGTAGVATAQTFPPLTGRVVDDAHLLTPEQTAALTQKLAALETQSKRQLVVVTLPSLQGYPIEDFSYQLGRAWGIGQKDKNDGALLIVAPTERKIRIESGPGVQGVLTDAVSSVIINTAIKPRFKAGDMAGGIAAGVDEIVRVLQLPPDEAARVAADAAKSQAHTVSRSGRGGGPSFGTIILLGIFFVFFVLPILRSMRGGGQRYGAGGVRVYPGGGFGSGFGGGFFGSLAGNLAANAIERGLRGDRGSSWGGGSDWGGGGGWSSSDDSFSGGGGSFDGGGASGDW